MQLEYDDNDNKQTTEMIVDYLKQRENVDKYELFTLFDNARREIFELLTFAFIRFKNTEQFIEIAKTLTTKVAQ